VLECNCNSPYWAYGLLAHVHCNPSLLGYIMKVTSLIRVCGVSTWYRANHDFFFAARTISLRGRAPPHHAPSRRRVSARPLARAPRAVASLLTSHAPPRRSTASRLAPAPLVRVRSPLARTRDSARPPRFPGRRARTRSRRRPVKPPRDPPPPPLPSRAAQVAASRRCRHCRTIPLVLLRPPVSDS
jgi:hypothetical protein